MVLEMEAGGQIQARVCGRLAGAIGETHGKGDSAGQRSRAEAVAAQGTNQGDARQSNRGHGIRDVSGTRRHSGQHKDAL